jgi:hypothetical protein
MSYQNTGYTRKKVLTVTKGDHTANYDITVSFTPPGGKTYGELTTAEFGQLTDTQYQTRLAAFCQYVYSLEDGLQADCPDLTLGSTGHNTNLCPLS